MRMELNYFIFTSGEKGVHGFDWGVKFLSAKNSLQNPHNLDEFYRKTLSEFNLSPSLERPENIGVLLIPFADENLLGFIFPGHDLKGRPNTITIACKIPDEISKRFNVNDAVKILWNSNNITQISKNNRPDTLAFNDEISSANEFPFVNLTAWPNVNNGYIVIDGKVRELHREIEPKKIKPRSNKTWIVLAGVLFAGLIIFYGASKFSSPAKKILPTTITPPTPDIHTEIISAEKVIDEKKITPPENKNLKIPDGFGFINENSFKEILKSLYVEREIGKIQLMEKMLMVPTEKKEAEFKSDLTKIFYTETTFEVNAPLFNKNIFIREILKHIKFNSNDAVIYFWDKDNRFENNNADIDFYIDNFIEQALKKIPSENGKLKGVFFKN